MQLSVSLLGESGELLTQTQAAQAGLPLAFQTSTLEVNKIIYVQIKDLSLAAQTPSDLTKKYSLELKPIAPTTAPPPPAPLAQPQPQQAEVTQPTPPVVPAAPTEAAPQAKEEVKAEAKPEVQEPKKTSSLRSRLSQNKKEDSCLSKGCGMVSIPRFKMKFILLIFICRWLPIFTATISMALLIG